MLAIQPATNPTSKNRINSRMMLSMPEMGPLIAKGRAADVYEYGEGRVLRRYRTDHDCVYEARVMRHVAEHDYPVPEVYEAEGRDIVMQRLEGPTMLTALPKRPWLIDGHGQTVADLVKQLHAIPAPAWLKPKHGGEGNTLVHLDLHPDNVMLTPQGPVVIDWSNAGRGIPEAEVADLWLVLSNANPPSKLIERLLVQAGRKLFVNAFIKHFDRDAIRRRLELAAELRLHDRNMTKVERERIQSFVEEWKL
jgi:aminoglycoside phosphotransferase (APT) family kinase protein